MAIDGNGEGRLRCLFLNRGELGDAGRGVQAVRIVLIGDRERARRDAPDAGGCRDNRHNGCARAGEKGETVLLRRRRTDRSQFFVHERINRRRLDRSLGNRRLGGSCGMSLLFVFRERPHKVSKRRIRMKEALAQPLLSTRSQARGAP